MIRTSFHSSDNEFIECNLRIRNLLNLSRTMDTLEKKAEVLIELFTFLYSTPRYLAANPNMRNLIVKETEKYMNCEQLSEDLRDVCRNLHELLT